MSLYIKKLLIIIALLVSSVALSDREKADRGIIPGQPLIQIQEGVGTEKAIGDYRKPAHCQPGSLVAW